MSGKKNNEENDCTTWRSQFGSFVYTKAQQNKNERKSLATTFLGDG